MQEETKFYTCRSDAAFKEVFMKKENKDILIPLLEKCLKIQIEDIEYLNLKDNVDNVHVRRKFYDLRVKTKDTILQVEVNSDIYKKSNTRQMAYITNEYSHYITRGNNYDEKIQIIQINFTYGLLTKFRNEKYKELYDEEEYRIYEVMDITGKMFIHNFKIYEFNMDYYMNFWYTKDKEKIEKNKLFIMMDLEPNELVKISKNDKVVSKYMEEIERVNEDPKFVHFMTEEEDREKLMNFLLEREKEIGIEEGMEQAKKQMILNLYKKDIDVKTISEASGLSIEEIKKIVEEK